MPPAPPLSDQSRRWTALRSLGLQPDIPSDTSGDTPSGASADGPVAPAPVGNDGFMALALCIARLTESPVALIHLVGETRDWMLAAHGLDPQAPFPSLAFCHHAMQGRDLFEVTDAAHDPRFADDVLVTGPTALRCYAGVPLVLNGVAVGTLCVAGHEARNLPAAHRETLKCLAHAAVGLLRERQRLMAVDAERERLIDLARSSGDWMWEADAELRYTWLSDGFEAVTGIDADSMRGQPIDAAQTANGSDDVGLRSLLQGRQPLARVVTAEQTPKGLLQISRSAVPVFDTRGRFTGYRGTARDVSSQVSSERQAYAQVELLRKLSSQVPGVIFQLWLRPDHSVEHLYGSDAAREMFGVEPPRDGNGGDPRAACKHMHPDDEVDFMRGMVDAARALRPWHREFRTVRDGRERWLELRGVPEPHPEGGTLWHGFVSDATQRKQTELALRSSEERWGMAAEAAGIGIAQFDWPSGRLSLDARACATHGLPHPQAALTLDDWLACIHPDDREAAGRSIHQALATGGAFEARYRVQRPDGDVSTLEVFARCTRNAAGEVNGLVGTCRDVTQQIALEQLRAEKETAERANRAKSEFLSRVSHELRTPLNGILGFAQLMALDRVHPLADDQSRRLDNVMRAGRHLLDLINDVLNLARIEHEDFVLQRVPVELAASVDAVVALLQPQAEAAGVVVSVLHASAVPVWAEADERAVEQVLLNLLSNAIKYNKPRGAVRISLSRHAGGVQVSVADEGDGFSVAQKALLFQPFRRFGADKRHVEGSGLGLVIARELAHAMNGELQVASLAGAGSTFTLSLPAADGSPAVRPDDVAPVLAFHDVPQRASASGEASARPADLLPLTTSAAVARRQVLYIEDEPLNVLLMQELFKSRPAWKLHVAINGNDGLAMAAAKPHDLLLVDMNLPDMNGLQLIRRLRADARMAGQRCIALSADAMQAQIDAALAAGYDDYWTKPINVARILEGLARLLPR
jgi:PAS domain S-box-containing protein